MAVAKTGNSHPRADYLDFNLKYLFFVGCWPDENKSPKFLKLYKIYEITCFICSFVFLIMTGIGIYMQDDIIICIADIDKTAAAYNYMLKIILFFYKREDIKVFISEILHSGDKIDEKRKRLMMINAIAITGCTVAITGFFQAVALSKGQLMVDHWQPFDPMKNNLNIIAANLIIGTLFLPFVGRAMAIQGLLCSLIMYMCDQLMELQIRLRALRYSKEKESEMRQELKEIIKKHIRLMGYSQSFTSNFKDYFLVQNIALTVGMCLNALMVTIVGFEQLNHLISFAAFLLATLIYTFSFCYLGNQLMDKSSGIAKVAYEIPWTTWPVDLQKDLLILIMVAQKSFVISAGGIANMSMETFSQILYQGYSMFTILRDMVG